MSDSNPSWTKTKELVATILEAEPADRERQIKDIEADDPEPARTIRAMVEAHTSSEDVLFESMDVLVGAAPVPTVEQGRSFIKGYTIERLLARGGTSDVYLARQDNPDRAVAIKLFRAGLSGPRQVARFQSEVEILSRLRHPSIAAIYAAGVATGVAPIELPYLVMEHIEGRSLTAHADDRGLSTRERLGLLAAVCDGVHAAHQRGVTHRDLKPANIIVDANGTPKILDFGAAKLDEAQPGQTFARTISGELVGTLAYMSPEQVGADPGEIDSRTDVYALGVVAHELLTDKPPLEVAKMSVPDAIREISRGANPSPALRGLPDGDDIDAVVRKALDTDKDRRYDSAAALAADLRRVVAGEPVEARPPTTMYRFRKFAGRNKAMVLGVALASVAILSLSAVSVVGFVRASAQRDRAVAANERESKFSDYIRTMLTSADPEELGPDAKIVDVLKTWGGDIDESFPDSPDVRARLHTLMGETYYALGQYDDSELHYRSALEIAIPGAEIPQLSRLDLLCGLANTLHYLGRLDEAGEILADAVPRARELHGDRHPTTFALRESDAEVRRIAGELDEAERAFVSLATDTEAELGESSVQHLSALGGLVRALLEAQRSAEAVDIARRIVEIREEHYGVDHPGTLIAQSNLGTALTDIGRFEEAADILQRSIRVGELRLGPLHHTVRTARGALVDPLYRMDRSEEALALSRRVLADDRAVYGDDHPDVATSMSNLATMLMELEQYDEAAELTGGAHAMLTEAFGEDHPRSIIALSNHAVALQGTGRLDEAAEVMTALHARMHETLGPTDAQTIISGNNLAMLWHEIGEYERGAEMLAQVVADAERSPECPVYFVATFERNLGRCLLGLERFKEAESHLLRSHQLLTDDGSPQQMLDRTAEFLIELYEIWGKPEQADRWRPEPVGET